MIHWHNSQVILKIVHKSIFVRFRLHNLNDTSKGQILSNVLVLLELCQQGMCCNRWWWVRSHGEPPQGKEVFVCLAQDSTVAASVLWSWKGLGSKYVQSMSSPSSGEHPCLFLKSVTKETLREKLDITCWVKRFRPAPHYGCESDLAATFVTSLIARVDSASSDYQWRWSYFLFFLCLLACLPIYILLYLQSDLQKISKT